MNVTLSIVTPTYNRFDLLMKCMESLKNQTSFDFEWIVIDDGSSDGTKEEMEKLSFDHLPFPMVYHWKENGGKHTALNASHPYIHGKYVLLLDNDDTLTNDAVETVLASWKKYENNQQIGMVTFLKALTDGTLCCYVKEEGIPLDVLDHERIVNVASDCCEVIRSELFLQYPFPVFEGERFLAETALWYRAGLDHKCVYVNKPVYICEYLEDGLTKGGKNLRIRNCHGGMYTSWLRMNPRCSRKERLKAGLLFVCYGRFAKYSMKQILKEAKQYKAFCALCMIPGSLLHCYWNWKYMRK